MTIPVVPTPSSVFVAVSTVDFGHSKGRVVVSFCYFNLQFPNEICTLAWKIPWMENPGGLPSMGSHRVGHD